MKNEIKSALIVLSLIASACGSAPADVATATAKNNASSTLSYTYAQAVQICAALRAWMPAVNNIQFPGDPGSVAVYFFSNTKITQNGLTLTTDLLNIGTGGAPVCTVTIQGGVMTQVQ